MRPDRPVHRALPSALAALGLLLAAGAGLPLPAGTAHAATAYKLSGKQRLVSIAPATAGRDATVCVEPRPLCVGAGAAACSEDTAPEAELLRRGLFHICRGYQKGQLSAEDYRTSLAAYPALVAEVAALDLLDRPALGGRDSSEARAVARRLASNPALPVFCRTVPLEAHLAAIVAGDTRLAAACLAASPLIPKE